MHAITNLKTGTAIDNDSIVSESADGVLVKNYDCIKFIPASDLKIEEKAEDGVYSKNEAAPEYGFARDDFSSDYYTEKAEYRLGISGLEFKTATYFKDTAIVSKAIDVSKCEYITLSVKESEAYNSFAEYSILDGTDEEVPILPEGRGEVAGEKLFYGLPTRFTVNRSQKEPVLYEDGAINSKDYALLSGDDFDSHEYVISYIPGGENVHKYIPKNGIVRLKIVIRNFTDTFSPVEVSDIRLVLWGSGT